MPSAAAVMDKVRAVLPETLGQQLDLVRTWAPADHAREAISIDQAALRHAIRDHRKVRFTYRDADGRATDRVVRPLIMAFYGPVWLLAAWCEVREGFRVFRLDRMADFGVLDVNFAAEPGKTAMDFLKQDDAGKEGSGSRAV